VEEYCCEDAEYIAVCIGSLAYQLRGVVDALRAEGVRVGVMGVHLYRPFPDEVIARCLQKAKKVIVFEKALSYGYEGALFSDIKSALYPCPERPLMENFILGLGGREIRTADLYENLKKSCTPLQGVSNTPGWIGLRLQDKKS
jgi:pyruvate/2-oxoacid:ferredoxin oxidoreductase alpha subunit